MTPNAVDAARLLTLNTTRPAAPVSIAQSTRVGARLKTLRNELLEHGGELQGLLEPAGVHLVNEALRVLKAQVCKIAVVGQIKAGKSSFVNALVHQKELLPTDVNPWTTAVTNLHLGQSSTGNEAAIFQFFTQDEWARLAEGGGRLRELTERLVPGFEHELLQQNLAALRERAATRLGDQFEALLGQTHRFATLTPETLTQYVVSGDHAMGRGGAGVGRYSDITRAADLYLPPGPFDFPSSVIDTPGTNDPFLIRDEITRRCLEQADLYIVVLTARQPLMASDLALLRVLRGLHKERIVVFINRIDELGDIGRDSVEVANFVRERMAIEFPGSDIPVIAGSARWAMTALRPEPDRGGAARPDTAIERGTLAYLQERGLLRREEFVRPAEEGAPPFDVRPALFAGSGIPQVYEALDRLLDASHCAHVMRHIYGCFAEMARASEGAALADLQSVNNIHHATLETAERTRGRLQTLHAELQRLQEVAVVIERSASEFELRLREFLAEDLGTLRVKLGNEVMVFATEERNALVSILLNGSPPRVWRCEPNPLRRRLADEFFQAFQATEARITDMQQRVLPKLGQLFAQMSGGAEQPAQADAAVQPIRAPTMAPLADYLALDLDQAWWNGWWRRRPSPAERGRELENLIKAEFDRVVEDLLRAYETAITSHISSTTMWTIGVCNNILQVIFKRREQINAEFAALTGNPADNPDVDRLHEQHRQISTLSDRVMRCNTLSKRLQAMAADVAREPVRRLPGATG